MAGTDGQVIMLNMNVRLPLLLLTYVHKKSYVYAETYNKRVLRSWGYQKWLFSDKNVIIRLLQP